MLCEFLMVGDKHCKLKATKNSNYCKIHNYNAKKSKVYKCKLCNKGTFAKYQVCSKCDAHKIRLKKRYEYIAECRKFRHIDIS